jgi:hypothetical protein
LSATHAREYPSRMHPYTHIHTAEMMAIRGSMGVIVIMFEEVGGRKGGGGGGAPPLCRHTARRLPVYMYNVQVLSRANLSRY